MPTPANRAKIQLVRGSYANISASIADLLDGELCYAKDQNRLYMVEGSTLTEIEADPEDIEGLIASIIIGGTGITSTHNDGSDTVTLDLDNTAVTAGSYGTASAIPTFTVDAQGRITAASENAINTDVVLIEVHNQTGSDINKGDAVYVSGTHSSGKPTVNLADNDGSSTYPAIGLVYETITSGSDGFVIISGLLTQIPTSTLGNAGDPLYVDSTPGDLTTTRPTASTEKVQKVGLITRAHASNGTILIIGAGRTNDVNNEITALTGVALNESNLGTFSGSTISDDRTIKQALQELESKAETAIVDADISATAEIAVSKLANGTANQVLVTDGTDVSWSDDLVIAGNLTVQGTTTTVESTTVTVDDKNIELGSVATPTDVTADGGGITLKGATDKTINWVDATDAWTFSEHINIGATKEYRMNGTAVLAYDGTDRILDNVIVDGGTY
jgi:hypothetical protein